MIENGIEIRCKECGKKLATVSNGVMIQAQMKCSCGYYFGVSNVRNLNILEYL